MKVDLRKHVCIVTREKSDPKFYGHRYASGESRLLHHVKLELIEQRHDVIKKRAWKDGHMIGDDYQQIVRTRDRRARKDGTVIAVAGVGRGFIIWSGFYALRGANEDFNAGSVELRVDRY